ADGVDILRLLGDADVAVDRATLLGETGLIDDTDALAFEVRRHAKHATDGDDTGAADAGDDDRIGLAHRWLGGFGQRRQISRRFDAFAALELRALDGDERGAEALQAGEVLVAARLVDGALAAPLGLERLHRHAVRLHAAVAAALADQLVD